MAIDQLQRPAGQTEILVVEDERAVAQFIRRCLQAQGYRVSGIAASAEAALGQLEERTPALVIMDIRLEGPTDGVELAGQIRARWRLPIVYVTGQGDDETMRRLVSTGPFGFVRKPFDDVQLHGAVEVALARAGEERESERELKRSLRHGDELAAATARLESRLRKIAEAIGVEPPAGVGADSDLPGPLQARLAGLSRREREVLDRLREGQRVASIARGLSVSPFTVRNHLRALFRKLDVHSQEELLDLIRGVPGRAVGSRGSTDQDA
jgi:two-component system, response regulator PdtaR